MRTRSVAVALLVALMPAAVSTSAFAQTTEDPVLKAARARFNEGVDFYDKGQYENARAAFMQAYALRKHPAVLVNLAQSDLHSGHALEAAKYFQQYLRDSTSLSAVQRADAEKGLAEARTKLGQLEVSAPSGAEISLDGESVGTAPLSEPMDVEPGSHTIRSGSDSKTVLVAAGQVTPVRLGASVAGVLTPTPPPVAEGTPSSASPSASTEAATPPAKRGILSPPKNMAPVWIGLGIGAAGTVTAIVFAALKGQASSNADSVSNQIVGAANASGIANTQGLCLHPPSQDFQGACQVLRNDYSLVNANATVANIGIGVGMAGIALSVAWYLFATKRDVEPAAAAASGAWAPFVGSHEYGVGYAGSF